MLEIIEYGKDNYEFPALIVLGCFDAIHSGHRELLKKAKLQAKINGLDLGVMMFKDGKSGKLLYSFDERVKMLEEFNVKFVIAIDFNDEFKKIAPLAFLNDIDDHINVKAYMSGKDFRFGAGAKGKASTLKNFAEDDENGVWYMNVKDVDLDGEKISTTLIKSCLDSGNVEKAAKLLGRAYSLTGEVVKGAGRGTSIVGYPTVNISNPEWKYPVKQGVYNVSCEIDGTLYNGVANFGTCPTFEDERVALEAYFEGYEGDLYGRVLTINFISYIRDIEKFDSAEELSAQVTSDIAGTCEQVETVEEQPVEQATEEAAEEESVAEVTEEVAEEQPVEQVTEEAAEEESVAEVTEEVAEEQPVEQVTEEAAEEETAVSESVEEEVVAEESTIENTEACSSCEAEQSEEKNEGGETADD
ncbi:MAG: riboflavin biosynthesis protein RibF [Candidatus Coproplasma sp.]